MKWCIALSLLLLAPGSARAATDPSAEVRTRVAALQLAPADADALLSPLDHARAAQLPEAPVAAKILEGLAKNVPPARIGAAAEQVVSRLGDAQAALDAAQARAPDRTAALSELALLEARLGSRAALLQLATRARGATGEALVAAGNACAELRAAGIAPERAAELVGGLAAHGYAPEQILGVPRLLQQYQAEGGRDVPAFLEELEHRGQSGGELREAIDPFAPRGQVLNHSRDPAPGKPDDPGRGGRPLVEDPQRGGSNPAADDDLATRTGRGMGQPPNGNTSGGGQGKGKGKGKGPGSSPGNLGNDPGQP